MWRRRRKSTWKRTQRFHTIQVEPLEKRELLTVGPQVTGISIHDDNAALPWHDISNLSGPRLLPWSGVDEIAIQFSENVDVDENDLHVAGTITDSYDFDAFNYDSTTHQAIWSLTTAITEAEALQLSISPDVTAVDDGAALDGFLNVTTGVETTQYPGQPLLFRVNVRSGDASRDGTVNDADLQLLFDQYGDQGDWLASDFNLDGTVNADDYMTFATAWGAGSVASARVQVTAVVVTDADELEISYTVSGADTPEFSIGLYTSTVGNVPDTLAHTIRVTSDEMRTGGGAMHTITVPLADVTSVAPQEFRDGYNVVAVVDTGGEVVEDDKTNNEAWWTPERGRRAETVTQLADGDEGSGAMGAEEVTLTLSTGTTYALIGQQANGLFDMVEATTPTGEATVILQLKPDADPPTTGTVDFVLESRTFTLVNRRYHLSVGFMRDGFVETFLDDRKHESAESGSSPSVFEALRTVSTVGADGRLTDGKLQSVDDSLNRLARVAELVGGGAGEFFTPTQRRDAYAGLSALSDTIADDLASETAAAQTAIDAAIAAEDPFAEYEARRALADAQSRAGARKTRLGEAVLNLGESIHEDLASGNPDVAAAAVQLRDALLADANSYYTMWTGLDVNYEMLREKRAGDTIEYTFALYDVGGYVLDDGVMLDLGRAASIESNAELSPDSAPYVPPAPDSVTIEGSSDVQDTYVVEGSTVTPDDYDKARVIGDPVTPLDRDAYFRFNLTDEKLYVPTDADAILQVIAESGDPTHTATATLEDWSASTLDWSVADGLAKASGPFATWTPSLGSVSLDALQAVRRSLRLGDANLDGQFDGDDVDAFNLALIDPSAHTAQYGVRESYAGELLDTVDWNQDGTVDTNDIDGILARLELLAADFNADGNVDGNDYVEWASNYGRSGDAWHHDGDADFDQDVDGLDNLKWADQFGDDAEAYLPSFAFQIHEIAPDNATGSVQYATVENATASYRPKLTIEAPADVFVTEFDVDQDTGQLHVGYRVLNDTFSDIDIEVWRSADGTQLDQMMQTHQATGFDIGYHEESFDADFSNDSSTDYQLFVKIVTTGPTESDTSNNEKEFAGGVFLEDVGNGNHRLHVHGTSADDRVAIGDESIELNGVYHDLSDYSLADVYVRTHGGDDVITSVADTSTPWFAFGGEGDDRLESGGGDDVLAGGGGDDTYVFAGSHSLGTDTIVEATGGGTDRLDFAQITDTDETDTDGITLDLTSTAPAGPDLILGTVAAPLLKFEAIGSEEIEIVVGTDDDDDITGNTLANSIYAGLGSDVVHGGSGDDELFGGDGGDTIYGDLGNDVIFAGAGDDTVYGGDGNDTIHGQDGSDLIYGGTNDDYIGGGEGDDTLHGNEGDDELYGDGGADDLFGDDDNDRLDGGSGGNNLDGGDGDDVYIFAIDENVIHTVTDDVGNDTLDLSAYPAGVTLTLGANNTSLGGMNQAQINLSGAVTVTTLIGTDDVDVLTGSAAADTIEGRGGDDIIAGAGGDDVILGGAGADTIDGGAGSDTIRGGADDDILTITAAEDGSDSVYGETGNDTYTVDGDNVTVGTGTHVLYDGVGDDRYVFLGAKPGNVEIQPDPVVSDGEDTIEFDDIGVNVSLADTGSQDVLGAAGTLMLTLAPHVIENVIGSSDSDTISGDDAVNTLRGGEGDDTLTGGGGSDTLLGGGGDDILRGFDAFGIVHGDAGLDTFVGISTIDVVDNGDESVVGQYAETGAAGDWLDSPFAGAFSGGQRFAESTATGDPTATWTFANLAAGDYDVYVTWTPDPSDVDGSADPTIGATDAPYIVTHGTTTESAIDVDQSVAPVGRNAGGRTWQRIGDAYSVANGETITVQLTNDADGRVYADAVHLVQRAPVVTLTSNANPPAFDANNMPPTTIDDAKEGDAITFTFRVEDGSSGPDVDVTLGPRAPANATIVPDTNTTDLHDYIFTWVTTEDDDGVHEFDIRVTDHGDAPLRISHSLTISVAETVDSVNFVAGGMRLVHDTGTTMDNDVTADQRVTATVDNPEAREQIEIEVDYDYDGDFDANEIVDVALTPLAGTQASFVFEPSRSVLTFEASNTIAIRTRVWDPNLIPEGSSTPDGDFVYSDTVETLTFTPSYEDVNNDELPDENVLPQIDTLALLNDTGEYDDDNRSTDVTLVGTVSHVDGDIGGLTVAFYSDADTTNDQYLIGTATTDNMGKFEFRPYALTDPVIADTMDNGEADLELWAIVEEKLPLMPGDASPLRADSSTATHLEFTYVEDTVPSITSYSLLQDTGADDSGNTVVVSANISLQGMISDPDGNVEKIVVEFDEGGDGTVDGYAVTDGSGAFEYSPLTFSHLESKPVNVRVLDWDYYTSTPIEGSWYTPTWSIKYDTTDVSAPNVNAFGPKYNNGLSVVSDATLVGTVSGEGGHEGVTVEFSLQPVDFITKRFAETIGSTLTDDAGAFIFTPVGLPIGVPVTVYAQAVSWNALSNSESFTDTGTQQTTFTLTDVPIPPDAFSVSLAHDTGNSATDGETSVLLFTGNVDFSGDPTKLVVEFDYDGVAGVDATTTFDEAGNLEYTPEGIVPGVWTDVKVRIRVPDYGVQPDELLESDLGADELLVGYDPVSEKWSDSVLAAWFDDLVAGGDLTMPEDEYSTSFDTMRDGVFADVTTDWTTISVKYNPSIDQPPTLDALPYVETITERTNPTIAGTIGDDGVVGGLLVEFLIDTDGAGTLVLDGSTTTDDTGNFSYTFQHHTNGDEPFVIRVHEPQYGATTTNAVDFSTYGVYPLMLYIGTRDDLVTKSLTLKNPVTSIDPTLVGTVELTSVADGQFVELDYDSDGRPDAVTYPNGSGDFEITPRGLSGNVTVQARMVEELVDASTGSTYRTFGDWVGHSWTVVTDTLGDIVNLELADDTGNTGLGYDVLDLVTANPTLVGTISNDDSLGNVRIEFDHDGDGMVDGAAVTDASGAFEYVPTGLTPGYWDIRARVVEQDANSTELLVGDWYHVSADGSPLAEEAGTGAPPAGTAYGFSLVQPTAATVSTLSQVGVHEGLADLTFDPVSVHFDPTLTGTVTDVDSFDGVAVEFFLDGSNEPFASTSVAPDGTFSHLPIGIPFGSHTVVARAVEWDHVNSTEIVGSPSSSVPLIVESTGDYEDDLANLDDGVDWALSPFEITSVDIIGTDTMLRPKLEAVVGIPEFYSDGVNYPFVTPLYVEFDVGNDGSIEGMSRAYDIVVNASTGASEYHFFVDPEISSSSSAVNIAVRPVGIDQYSLMMADWVVASVTYNAYPPAVDPTITVVGDDGNMNTTDPTIEGIVDASTLPAGYDVAKIEFDFDLDGDGEPDDTVQADTNGGFSYTVDTALPGEIDLRVRAVRYHDYTVTSDDGVAEYQASERIEGDWTDVSFALLDTAIEVSDLTLVEFTGVSPDIETTNPTIAGEVTSDDGRNLAGITVEIDQNDDGFADGTTILLLDKQNELDPDDDKYIFEYTPSNLQPGPVTLRVRAVDPFTTGEYLESEWVEYTFTLNQIDAPTIDSLGLAVDEDPGTAVVSSSPVLVGTASRDETVSRLVIEFSHGVDGVVDGTAQADLLGNFNYSPQDLPYGDNTIKARAVAYVGSEIIEGAWTNGYTFFYASTDPPIVNSLDVVDDTTGEISGRVTVGGYGRAVTIEIARDDNGTPVTNGHTTTNSAGYFTYVPTELVEGSVTLKVRGLFQDPSSGSLVTGDWLDKSFTYSPPAVGTVSLTEFDLAYDTGTPDTGTIVTSDPTFRGTVSASEEDILAGLYVEFDDVNITESEFPAVRVQPDGSYEFVPTDLVENTTYTYQARTRRWNPAVQVAAYEQGDWSSTVTFKLDSTDHTAATVETLDLLNNDSGVGQTQQAAEAVFKGTINTDGNPAGATIEFDHNGDGVIDGTATADAEGGFLYRAEGFVPSATSYTITARVVETDYHGSARAAGATNSLEFKLVEAPLVDHLNLFMANGTDPIVNGGIISTASSLRIEYQLLGNYDRWPDPPTTVGAFSPNEPVETETVRSDGSFTIDVNAESLGNGPATLVVRAVDEDGSVDVPGPWKTLRFEIAPTTVTAPAINDFDLVEDTGSTTNESSNIAVKGTMGAAGAFTVVEISVINGNNTTKTRTVADADGNFEVTPDGIPPNTTVDIEARSVVYDPSLDPALHPELAPTSDPEVLGTAATLTGVKHVDVNNMATFLTFDVTVSADDVAVVTGTVDNDGRTAGLRIEFNWTGDENIDGFAFTDENGAFTFTPYGLSSGEHTIKGRIVEWDGYDQQYVAPDFAEGLPGGVAEKTFMLTGDGPQEPAFDGAVAAKLEVVDLADAGFRDAVFALLAQSAVAGTESGAIDVAVGQITLLHRGGADTVDDENADFSSAAFDFYDTGYLPASVSDTTTGPTSVTVSTDAGGDVTADVTIRQYVDVDAPNSQIDVIIEFEVTNIVYTLVTASSETVGTTTTETVVDLDIGSESDAGYDFVFTASATYTGSGPGNYAVSGTHEITEVVDYDYLRTKTDTSSSDDQSGAPPIITTQSTPGDYSYSYEEGTAGAGGTAIFSGDGTTQPYSYTETIRLEDWTNDGGTEPTSNGTRTYSIITHTLYVETTTNTGEISVDSAGNQVTTGTITIDATGDLTSRETDEVEYLNDFDGLGYEQGTRSTSDDVTYHGHLIETIEYEADADAAGSVTFDDNLHVIHQESGEGKTYTDLSSGDVVDATEETWNYGIASTVDSFATINGTWDTVEGVDNGLDTKAHVTSSVVTDFEMAGGTTDRADYIFSSPSSYSSNDNSDSGTVIANSTLSANSSGYEDRTTDAVNDKYVSSGDASTTFSSSYSRSESVNDTSTLYGSTRDESSSYQERRNGSGASNGTIKTTFHETNSGSNVVGTRDVYATTDVVIASQSHGTIYDKVIDEDVPYRNDDVSSLNSQFNDDGRFSITRGSIIVEGEQLQPGSVSEGHATTVVMTTALSTRFSKDTSFCFLSNPLAPEIPGYQQEPMGNCDVPLDTNYVLVRTESADVQSEDYTYVNNDGMLSKQGRFSDSHDTTAVTERNSHGTFSDGTTYDYHRDDGAQSGDDAHGTFRENGGIRAGEGIQHSSGSSYSHDTTLVKQSTGEGTNSSFKARLFAENNANSSGAGEGPIVLGPNGVQQGQTEVDYKSTRRSFKQVVTHKEAFSDDQAGNTERTIRGAFNETSTENHDSGRRTIDLGRGGITTKDMADIDSTDHIKERVVFDTTTKTTETNSALETVTEVRKVGGLTSSVTDGHVVGPSEFRLTDSGESVKLDPTITTTTDNTTIFYVIRDHHEPTYGAFTAVTRTLSNGGETTVKGHYTRSTGEPMYGTEDFDKSEYLADTTVTGHNWHSIKDGWFRTSDGTEQVSDGILATSNGNVVVSKTDKSKKENVTVTRAATEDSLETIGYLVRLGTAADYTLLFETETVDTNGVAVNGIGATVENDKITGVTDDDGEDGTSFTSIMTTSDGLSLQASPTRNYIELDHGERLQLTTTGEQLDLAIDAFQGRTDGFGIGVDASDHVVIERANETLVAWEVFRVEPINRDLGEQPAPYFPGVDGSTLPDEKETFASQRIETRDKTTKTIGENVFIAVPQIADDPTQYGNGGEIEDVYGDGIVTTVEHFDRTESYSTVNSIANDYPFVDGPFVFQGQMYYSLDQTDSTTSHTTFADDSVPYTLVMDPSDNYPETPPVRIDVGTYFGERKTTIVENEQLGYRDMYSKSSPTGAVRMELGDGERSVHSTETGRYDRDVFVYGDGTSENLVLMDHQENLRGYKSELETTNYLIANNVTDLVPGGVNVQSTESKTTSLIRTFDRKHEWDDVRNIGDPNYEHTWEGVESENTTVIQTPDGVISKTSGGHRYGKMVDNVGHHTAAIFPTMSFEEDIATLIYTSVHINDFDYADEPVRGQIDTSSWKQPTDDPVAAAFEAYIWALSRAYERFVEPLLKTSVTTVPLAFLIDTRVDSDQLAEEFFISEESKLYNEAGFILAENAALGAVAEAVGPALSGARALQGGGRLARTARAAAIGLEVANVAEGVVNGYNAVSHLANNEYAAASVDLAKLSGNISLGGALERFRPRGPLYEPRLGEIPRGGCFVVDTQVVLAGEAAMAVGTNDVDASSSAAGRSSNLGGWILVGIGLTASCGATARSVRRRRRRAQLDAALWATGDSDVGSSDGAYDDTLCREMALARYGGDGDRLVRSVHDQLFAESDWPVGRHSPGSGSGTHSADLPWLAKLATIDHMPSTEATHCGTVARPRYAKDPKTMFSTLRNRLETVLPVVLFCMTGLLAWVLAGGDVEPAATASSTVSQSVPAQEMPLPTASIQDIPVGRKVWVDGNPEGEFDERFGEVVPETWRKMVLLAHKRDGTTADVEMLRPLWWLQERDVHAGGQVDIEVPECGIDGLADVLAVKPCPKVETGPGRVVTATFHHQSADTINVYVEGEDEPIGTTVNHPFWSETEQEFVRADMLRPGEEVRTLYGLAQVTSISERGPPEPVFNLEIHGEHVYHVGTVGTLVHNGGLHVLNCGFDLNSKALSRIRNKGVRDAWAAEQDLVRRTGQGTRRWTPAQKKELLETGKVKGFYGHHINSAKAFPELAADPNNIEFLNFQEHFNRHLRNWRNPTTGPLIDR